MPYATWLGVDLVSGLDKPYAIYSSFTYQTQMKWKSVAHMFSLFLSRQKENEPKPSNAIWAVWLGKIAFQRPLSNRHTHTHLDIITD